MDFHVVGSFSLHSLGFRAVKIKIEGCKSPVTEKTSAREVSKKQEGSRGPMEQVAAGSRRIPGFEEAVGVR